MKKEGNVEEAKRYFELSMINNSESIYEYAKLMVKIDEKKAAYFFEKAINQKCTKAMYKYGKKLVNNGQHMYGIQLIKEAADLGNVKAMYYCSLLREKRNNEIIKQPIFEEPAKLGHTESL